MKKHKPKKSKALNTSVSTYGRTKIRNIEDDLRWFSIVHHNKKKGLFSDDSDDDDFKQDQNYISKKSDASHKKISKQRPGAKRTSKKRKAAHKCLDEKENVSSQVSAAGDGINSTNKCNVSQNNLKNESFELPVKKVEKKIVISNSKISFSSLENNLVFPGKTESKNSYEDLIKPCSVTLNRIKLHLSSSNTTAGRQKSDFCSRNTSNSSIPSSFEPIITPCSVELKRYEISSQESAKLSKNVKQNNKKNTEMHDGLDGSFAKRKFVAPQSNCPRKSLLFSSPNLRYEEDKIPKDNSNSFSFLKSNYQPSFVALHSSKKKRVTCKRRRRRFDCKITDGLSTLSFSDVFKEPQESINMFQHSVITGHHDSNFDLHSILLQSFDVQCNASEPKRTLIQSTPLIKHHKNIFPSTITPFQKHHNSSVRFGSFLSSTPSLNNVSSRVSNLEQVNLDLSASYNAEKFENESLKRRQDDLSISVNKVLSECSQVVPRLFECLNYDKNSCQKLGEGVYGEVFRCLNASQITVAVKIIPVNGADIINQEKQKTFSEILPEIVNSSELSRLSDCTTNQTDAFIHLYGVHCVTGEYPSYFLNAWDDYRNERGTENDRPDFFPISQHYIVFEFSDGGIDMEHYNFRNAAQALSILQQVIAGLAVAEEVYQFEHRDLHWGNILVESTPDVKFISFNLAGVTKEINCVGVTAKIIDFTFSRMTQGGLGLYHDLSSDADLFTGDSSVDYQFEIYRLMKKETNNDWALYKPKTNVFWIHYLLHKFLNKVTYRLTKSKLHSNAVKKLKAFNKIVLDYDSCSQIVLNNSLFCT